MLTYTTIFVTCVIVAFVIGFLYKKIAESSGSAYSSKSKSAIIGLSASQLAEKAKSKTAAPNKKLQGRTYHYASGDMTLVHAGVPTGDTPINLLEDVHQIGEQTVLYKTGNKKTSHCSLYEADTSESGFTQEQNVGLAHNDGNPESRGKFYNEPVKGEPVHSSRRTARERWGW